MSGLVERLAERWQRVFDASLDWDENRQARWWTLEIAKKLETHGIVHVPAEGSEPQILYPYADAGRWLRSRAQGGDEGA